MQPSRRRPCSRSRTPTSRGYRCMTRCGRSSSSRSRISRWVAPSWTRCGGSRISNGTASGVISAPSTVPTAARRRPRDAEQGRCPSCRGTIFLTDMLGFHMDMGDDSAPEGVVTAYMAVYETLLLFSAIRHYWEVRRDLLSDCLFIKDGPLALFGQY